MVIFDFFQYVGRPPSWISDTRVWTTHEGQGQGHGASEVPKIALFQVYLLRHLQWELVYDH